MILVARLLTVARRHVSLLLAVAYLVAIPAFALLYVSESGSFYSATAKYEPSHAAGTEWLADSLDNDISDQWWLATGTRRYSDDRYDFDVRDSLILLDLAGYDQGITFDVVAQLWYEEQPLASGGVTSGTVSVFTIHMPGTPMYDYRDGGYAIWSISISNHRGVEFNDGALFPWDGCGHAPPCEPALRLSTATSDALVDWWQAGQGFAQGTAATYERMLYLSAITITTVGYGDILPITDEARLHVAAEAVFGVVVAGAFLTSLSFRRRGPGRKRTDRTPLRLGSRGAIERPNA